ncbi:MAG: DUF4035 domain-containing protein [Pseudomonadota bacterium]
MGHREFMGWVAFYQLEPFGSYRDNLHAGMICSLLYNANRKKTAAAMEPKDFLLRDYWQQKEKDTAEFLGGLRALAKAKND